MISVREGSIETKGKALLESQQQTNGKDLKDCRRANFFRTAFHGRVNFRSSYPAIRESFYDNALRQAQKGMVFGLVSSTVGNNVWQPNGAKLGFAFC